jgi:hypothetical protein
LYIEICCGKKKKKVTALFSINIADIPFPIINQCMKKIEKNLKKKKLPLKKKTNNKNIQSTNVKNIQKFYIKQFTPLSLNIPIIPFPIINQCCKKKFEKS